MFIVRQCRTPHTEQQGPPGPGPPPAEVTRPPTEWGGRCLDGFVRIAQTLCASAFNCNLKVLAPLSSWCRNYMWPGLTLIIFTWSTEAGAILCVVSSLLEDNSRYEA